jgi:hypothetical protein
VRKTAAGWCFSEEDGTRCSVSRTASYAVGRGHVSLLTNSDAWHFKVVRKLTQTGATSAFEWKRRRVGPDLLVQQYRWIKLSLFTAATP